MVKYVINKNVKINWNLLVEKTFLVDINVLDSRMKSNVCLEEDCPDYNENWMGIIWCGICYIEGLENAPVVQICCGHIFHVHCVTT